MSSARNIFSRAGRQVGMILRSRLLAVAVLSVACAVMVTYVSVNMRAVTVVDGDTSTVVMTLNSAPIEVLKDAGVALGEDDKMVATLGSPAGRIEISRAFDVSVTADGITRVVRMTGGTVADVLELVGVTVGEYDMVSPDVQDPVENSTAVVVERVQYTEYTKTEKLGYDTEIRYTNALAKGASKIVQKGQAGEKVYVYRDRIVEGQVVDTILASEEVTVEPVNQVKLVGLGGVTPMSPAPFDIELDEKGHPLNYKQMFTGTACAYTVGENPKNKHTATGCDPAVGCVAVNPKKIPYGSKLYIVSASGDYVYGYGVACDTGSGVMNGSLIADLYMNTEAECRSFGKRRDMVVYVLE